MIALHCEYAGIPAGDWVAELIFRKIDKQLRVEGTSNGILGTHRLRRSARLQEKLTFWLSCAHFLISLKQEWALPAEASHSIVTKGCFGIRADILAICWTRLDDDKEVCFGKDVLQLRRGTLERLTKHLGSVRLNQIEWKELFSRIAEAQTALGQDSNPANFLNSTLGNNDVDLETVTSDLEAEVKAWEHRLSEHIELHKQALEPIVTQVLGSFPRGGPIVMQYSTRRDSLLNFLATEMIRKGVSPENISLQKWKSLF